MDPQNMTEPIVVVTRMTLGIALLNRSIITVKAIVHPENEWQVRERTYIGDVKG